MPRHAARKQVRRVDRCSEFLLTVSFGNLCSQVLQYRRIGLNQYSQRHLRAGYVVLSPRVPSEYGRLDRSATSCSAQLDKHGILLLPHRTLCTRPWG